MLFLLAACADVWEYSPKQKFDRDSPVGVNTQGVERILSTPGDDTVSFVFIGDAQRFYEEQEHFVAKVNTLPNLDFVIVAGDIADFGLLQELEWAHSRLSKLKVPYLTVIGNHDIVGTGEQAFTRFYGPLNYSFTFLGYKFVFHNTNSKEYATAIVPDMNWLAREVTDPQASYVVGVSHVAPFDADFARSLEMEYATLLRNQPNFLVSLHAHQHRHSDGYPYQDGVRYVVAHHFEAREFVHFKLINGQLIKTIQPF
mgnify:FL=1